MKVSLPQLISSLQTIDNITDNVYRSDGPHIGGVIGPNRLFGGYIAAQVYDAVNHFKNKSDSSKVIFSMHYNFISAGDPRKEIKLEIDRFDDIYTINVSHENKNIGLGHVKVDDNFLDSPKFPEGIPRLTSLPSVENQIERLPHEKLRNRFNLVLDKVIFEMRPFHLVTIPAPGDYRVVYYARIHPQCRDIVKEDAGMVAVVALSDFFVIQSAQNAMNYEGFRMSSGASLHHKVYFHKSYVEATQWFLVESRTEIVNANKAKIFGAVFDSNRDCVVSFIQEAYTVPESPQSSKL